MRPFALALSAAGFASLAAGQNVGPLPPLTAQVEVHVVNVDVSVTDRSGKPVTGLTKDDFEILEDGKPQKITNFSLFDGVEDRRSRLSGQAGLPVLHTDTRRRILLVIDNNYLAIIERNRALDTVQKYLEASGNGDWAIASIGHSVDMLQSFTSDKALLRAALAKARNMQSTEKQNDLDRRVLSERVVHQSDITVPVDYKEKIAFMNREQTYRNLLMIQNTARAVVDTARAYAAEDGKKFIVLLTGGMELNTSFSAFEKENDLELQQIRKQIGEISDAMVREANGANFTVYVVNARTREMQAPQHDVENQSSGMTGGNLLNNLMNDPIDTTDVDSIPLSIALGTGGMYLPSNNIAESLQKIDTVTSSFYSLGYSPQHDGDRQYHTIKVRVKQPAVRVANRVGYFDETQEDRLEEMLRLRTEFTGFGSLPVQVEIGNASPGERDLIVPVTAEMPLARITVIPREQDFVGRVHVYCSIFDENGQNVGFSHKTQEVTMNPQQHSSSGDFRYTMKVHLKKGSAFKIVITLRDELSNEMGSKSEAVQL